jgi:hypothetical protein
MTTHVHALAETLAAQPSTAEALPVPVAALHVGERAVTGYVSQAERALAAVPPAKVAAADRLTCLIDALTDYGASRSRTALPTAAYDTDRRQRMEAAYGRRTDAVVAGAEARGRELLATARLSFMDAAGYGQLARAERSTLSDVQRIALNALDGRWRGYQQRFTDARQRRAEIERLRSERAALDQ